MPDSGTRLQLDVWSQEGTLVVRPRGELELASYPLLRDCLLKCMAEQPDAVLVELGELRVQSSALLSVFVTVWMRCATWTTIPLVLAATREPLRSMLLASGAQRFVATHMTLAQSWASVEDPPPRRRAEFGLGGSHPDGQRVRGFVRSQCEHWNLAQVRDDAVLVASALVDNAVTDGGFPGLLRMELLSTGLAISVRGAETTRRRPSTDPLDEGGSRGLAIVSRICLAWGRWPTADGGELAWGVLPLPGRRHSLTR
jgi:anti-anti-sigma factor